MDFIRQTPASARPPELTELGKRIEMLRIDRGISKQHLARFAETSRQQLWRVMTGKSELTVALRSRIAEALDIQPAELDGRWPTTRSTVVLPVAAARDFAGYLASSSAIAETLATLPSGAAGRTLKRRVLDTLEDLALADGRRLDTAFFELRRRVLAGEL
jgi:transcriptional regulator with XRE-family HTH domain